MNTCDKTLPVINNEVHVLKLGGILDVEILYLQIWESWWCRVKEIVFKIHWHLFMLKSEGITMDDNIFNEVDIYRFTLKQICTHISCMGWKYLPGTYISKNNI